ncbi:MAG TPA: CerR family C-terminal domain-containing protein, partial [Candidatus Methylacidiphilales bacterium]|nr:CerR family C-terminal domain-containing protein [Candidatus Methylacidiphilales bacterium]
ATMMGADAREPLVIIRAHAMLGQMFGFITARETIRRRLGIGALGTVAPEVEEQAREAVALILEEHTEVLLRGLSAISGTDECAEAISGKLTESSQQNASGRSASSGSIVNVEHFP